MNSSAARPLPKRDPVGDAAWFADERGVDRRLKVSWHPDHRLLVLSLWHGDTCTATFRMGMSDVPRLVSALVDALGQAAGITGSQTSAAATDARRRMAASWYRWKRDRFR